MSIYAEVIERHIADLTQMVADRVAKCESHDDLDREIAKALEAVEAVSEMIHVTDLALGWVNGPTMAEITMRQRIRAALLRARGKK